MAAPSGSSEGLESNLTNKVAPTFKKSEETILKKIQREKSKTPKKITKHIFYVGTKNWPRPSSDVQDKIIAVLIKSLSSEPNIFKSQKQDSQPAKDCIRSQLAIGVSSVFRALEQDNLVCVLVSGQAKPASCVNHLIGLGQERGCPLLVIDHLASSIARATMSKVTPLAIGFKKSSPSGPRIFLEVVSLVEEHTSPKKVCQPLPEIAVKKIPELDGKCIRPISFGDDNVIEILNILERIISDAPREKTPDCDKISNKQKKKKKRDKKNPCIMSHFKASFRQQAEVGRRPVAALLCRRRLRLVLVTGEVEGHLAAGARDTPTDSFLRLALRYKCPVFCLPGMMEALRPHFGGGVSFLGLKSYSDREGNGEDYFKSFIDRVKDLMINRTALASKKPGNDDNDNSNVYLPIASTKKEEDKNIEEDESEEEDYSYLYIMKSDSKEFRRKLEKDQDISADTKKERNVNTNFKTSKSEAELESKVSRVEMKNKQNDTIDSPLFEVDRGGENKQKMSIEFETPIFELDRGEKKKQINDGETPLFELDRGGEHKIKKSETKPTIKTLESSSNQLALGETPGEVDNFQPHEPLASKKKGKKRKAEPDSSFMSFAYNETNIKTMVANIYKKKKRKKK